MLPFIAMFGALNAHAANHELNLELGRLGTQGEAFEVLSHYGTMGSVGARGGYALGERLTLVADYQHSQLGGSIDSYDEEDGEYMADGLIGFALRAQQIGVGVKYDVELWPWLHPYGTAQALGVVGVLRMDDDTEDDDNVNELRRVGVAPGGVAALGLDLIALRADRPVRPATYLEAGYAYVAPMKLGDAGDLDFRGFYLRWGLGARF